MLKHLVSISDLGKDEIEELLELVDLPRGSVQDKIVASCFFEPSTRTRLSFEAAAHRVGAKVIGFTEGKTTSTAKGETLADTVRTVSSYADLLVVRHPLEGAARVAAENSSVPVINAGDGANQHPTQTLLDLYTIKKEFGTLESLKIAIMGDLCHGRTVHSLVSALAHFKVRLYFLNPMNLDLPESLIQDLKEKGVLFSFHSDIKEIVDRLDVIYVTRIQKERSLVSEKGYALKLEDLEGAKKTLKIMHPLPRVDELDPRIDETDHALYFTQVKNGLAVRAALLHYFLGDAYVN